MKNQFEDRETGAEVRKNGCIEIVLVNERRYVNFESCFEEEKRYANLIYSTANLYDVNFVQLVEDVDGEDKKLRVVQRVFMTKIKDITLRKFLPRTYQSFYLESDRKREEKQDGK